MATVEVGDSGRLRDERDVRSNENGATLGRLRDERAAEDKRKIDRLEETQRLAEAEFQKTVITRLGQLDTITKDITVIKTKCVSCHEKIDAHHALLYGNPQAGTSGLTEKVKVQGERAEDVRATVFGTKDAPQVGLVYRFARMDGVHEAVFGTKDAPHVGLVHKVDKLEGRVSLMWKGLGIAASAALTALGKAFWKG